MDRRIYLKVKIKSLAEEARIIRQETKRAKLTSLKNGLYLHRVGTVRYEARHTHLAYGFLKGLEYRQIERNAREAPDWAKVRRMVEKYGAYWDTEGGVNSYTDFLSHKKEVLARFDKWIVETTTEVAS